MGYEVFISHCQDNEAARSLYDYLTAHGVGCFLDTVCLLPGELFTAHISEAREKCSVVILLLSSSSDGSIAVNSEMRDLYKKKKVIPLRIENYRPRNLMSFVGALQWLDAYEGPFEDHLPEVLAAVGNYINLDKSPVTDIQGPEAENTVSYLKQYFKEMSFNYPSFSTDEERITIGEHALRVLRLFDKYRVFNGAAFPVTLIDRDKFRIVLALHDIGMSLVANRGEMKLKYEAAGQSIHWLIQQKEFQEKYEFNAQEEKIAEALVSNEPLWGYLNRRFDEVTCAEQIMEMADRAGIEIDDAGFVHFFQLVMIYFLCDAGSYSTLAGGDRRYDFLSFDDAGGEIRLSGAEKERTDKLETVIRRITNTGRIWKRTKEKYLNDYARGLIDHGLFTNPAMKDIFHQVPDRLGREKYEKLLLLALNSAQSAKDGIVQLIGHYGGETSIIPLVTELKLFKPHSKADRDSDNHFTHKITAAFALISIGTPASLAALKELLKDSNWQARFAAAVALLYVSKRDGDAAEKAMLHDIIKECWQSAGVDLLKFINYAGNAVLPVRPEAGSNIHELPGNFVWNAVLPLLPGDDVRAAANRLLAAGNAGEVELACRLLGELGTAADLDGLQAAMNNPSFSKAAGAAIEQIKGRV